MPKSTIMTAVFENMRRLQMKKGFPVLILIVAAVNVTLISGKRRTIGILVSALHNSFGNKTTTMSQLNWIADSYAALAFFLVPFTATLLLRNSRPYQRAMFAAGGFIFLSCLTSAVVPSPAYLYFTQTVLHGLGSTLVIATCALIVGDYFDSGHRFHVLATALVSDGPLGVLVFGPFYAFLVQHYGWRNAFFFVGLVFLLVTLIAAFTFLPNIRELYVELDEGGAPLASSPQEPTAINNKGWAFPTISHIYENHQIVLWFAERIVHYIIVFDIMVNLTDFVSDRVGYKIESGAHINLAYGIGEMVIFVIGVSFGDRIRGHIVFVYLIGAFLALFLMFIIDFVFNSMGPLIILTGFLGFAIGSGNTCLYAVSEEVMLVHGSIGFPSSMMMTGIGMLLSPVFSGYIIDNLGYKAYFNCQTGLVAFRFLLLIAINAMMWEHRKKNVELERMRQELLAKAQLKAFKEPTVDEQLEMQSCKKSYHSDDVQFVE